MCCSHLRCCDNGRLTINCFKSQYLKCFKSPTTVLICVYSDLDFIGKSSHVLVCNEMLNWAASMHVFMLTEKPVTWRSALCPLQLECVFCISASSLGSCRSSSMEKVRSLTFILLVSFLRFSWHQNFNSFNLWASRTNMFLTTIVQQQS